MAKAEFVGIDLTSSPKKPSAYAVLGADRQITGLGFFGTNSEIVAAMDKQQPLLVAIDAPLSLPRGLCCLEESCPCQPDSIRKGRRCERELASMMIPCYFTTKRSFIRDMVNRGIGLREKLAARGHQVIEIYPYASKVRLFGKPIPKKTTAEGLKFLRERLMSIIPGLEPARLKNHDLCDAVVAAYTAYLHHQGRAEAIGDPDEGLIYIPVAFCDGLV